MGRRGINLAADLLSNAWVRKYHRAADVTASIDWVRQQIKHGPVAWEHHKVTSISVMVRTVVRGRHVTPQGDTAVHF